MWRIIVSFFCISFISNASYSQEASYDKSGYASLIIKFSGDYPKEKPITQINLSNFFVSEKPIDFHHLNDSTLFVSFYTYGPTLYYFFYNRQYCKGLLLPDKLDVLNINYVDSSEYSTHYTGSFKDLFNHSIENGEMIREALFSGNYFSRKKPVTYLSANDYRDSILKENERMLSNVSNKNHSEFMQNYFRYEMEGVSKLFFLYNDYNSRAYKEQKKDSLTIKTPLQRDLSFYENINITNYGDLDKYIAPQSNLLKAVRQDSLLRLPNILNSTPVEYKAQLEKIFGLEMKGKKNMFYEIMIAGAYMDNINIEVPLSEQQKLDILSFFSNSNISNYILYYNELISTNKSKSAKYYLPFKKEQDIVFDNIINQYKGKVIVMDFWATWCGPCLAAFSEIKKIKEKFENEDVVFVYLTNESSDKGSWNKQINYLGGEHYYLYYNQSKIINKRFAIEFLPSYLIFNKKGELAQQSLGAYMGNETLSKWINEALHP